MKRILLAAAFLSVASTAAHAQVEGSVPGVYDLSEVTEWIAAPDIATADIPSWFLATYDGRMDSTGTNCNIQTSSVEAQADALVSTMLAIDSDAFLAILREAGGNTSEIGPISEFSADGNRAIRYVSRSTYNSLPLTHLSLQHVAGDKLVTTTCTALEEVYGAHVPTIERFVDDVRYVNPNAINNLSQQSAPPPLIPAGVNTNEAAMVAAEALRRGIEASGAFRYRNGSE